MSRFDYFVVFAEMRTGSNFLEANLNSFDGMSCHGEAFNPHFIGYPKSENVLCVTQTQRESDPQSLIEALRNSDGLNGFRYFHDHDPRILETCLNDPRCAKIILTRNPVESFVSWKIAAETGQWKLTNVKHAKSEKITFDPQEFESHLEVLQQFQMRLMSGLQKTGQTAFYLAYEDLQDIDVMNGLAMFLGNESRLKTLDSKLKKQNPEPMSSKVANFDEMAASLSRLDRFNLNQTPSFEPRRGAMVPRYVAAAVSPMLFMPLKAGPTEAVLRWMCALDKVNADALATGFNQQTLRQWMRSHPGHRSFTVLRHPLARAHAAFCDHFLSVDEGGFLEIRKTLKQIHGVNLPNRSVVPETDDKYDLVAHGEAFLAFLKFIKSNLNAQTAVRVDPAWASQLALLQGMADFGMPDLILREQTLNGDLAMLSAQIGLKSMPKASTPTDRYHGRLSSIYSPEIEAAARDAYGRDYLTFGFNDWRA